MIFFLISLLASLFGGVSAGIAYNVYPIPVLSVNNPFAGVIEYWPFVIVFVLLLLAVLWYQTIKALRRYRRQKSGNQRSFGHSTVLLGVVSLVVLVLLFSPYYINRLGFGGDDDAATSAENQVEMVLTVEGMHCSGCESLINRKVAEMPGVDSVLATQSLEEVFVVYDKSKVSVDEIAQVIEDSGYSVILQ